MMTVTTNCEYTLQELQHALERGYGAYYDDPANYGCIVVYKTSTKWGNYYVVWWGDDPDDMCYYSRLESHFDRLRDRVSERGWRLMMPAEVNRWMKKVS